MITITKSFNINGNNYPYENDFTPETVEFELYHYGKCAGLIKEADGMIVKESKGNVYNTCAKILESKDEFNDFVDYIDERLTPADSFYGMDDVQIAKVLIDYALNEMPDRMPDDIDVVVCKSVRKLAEGNDLER